MTTQFLSSTCQNEIHRYLGVEERMALGQHVPAFRSQNKKLEYHVTKAQYWKVMGHQVGLSLDGTFIWITENWNKSTDPDYPVNVVVSIRKKVGGILKRVEFKNCKQFAGIRVMAGKMIAFYLDRLGTVVRETLRDIPWRYLQGWDNCIRTLSFFTEEQIPTEWWCELFEKVGARKSYLVPKTSGVWVEVIQTVNSHLPIGKSVELTGLKKREIEAVHNLQHQLPDAIVESRCFFTSGRIGMSWLTVRHPGYDLLVSLEGRNDDWKLIITKRRKIVEN